MPDIKIKLEMYEKMLRCRRSEEKLYYLFSTQSMPGTMHQYIGEEAVAVGVCQNLNDDDYITSTHRGHGHCIAKGIDLNAFMAEMFAKSTGSCKGMGGSMHIADFNVGILGANGIVGGGIPIAVGAALASKCKNDKKVTVSFFGDGATNEGAFHESLNMASVWNLPVIFVCENNMYGFSTHYKRVTNVEDISVRATAYGMKGFTVDGMDAVAVYGKVKEVIDGVRNGEGPVLIECKTYRYMGHARFENPVYRTKDEVEEWKKRDAIDRIRGEIISVDKGNKRLIEDIDQKVMDEIEAAVKFAEESPDPSPKSYKDYIYI